MRPRIELQPNSQGVQVILDFSLIDSDQWLALLQQPEQFFQAGYGLSGQTGDPALPQLTELIPISGPDTPTVTILEIRQREAITSPLKKTPPGHLEEDPPSILEAFNWATQISDPPLVGLGDPLELRGEHFLPLIIRPLSLDQDQHKVLLPEQFILQITGIQVSDAASINESGMIRSLIPTDALYGKLGHYLIITPPLFEPYLENLVEWKKRKGHPVTVVNTAEAGSSPTEIKEYIQNAYDTWEDPPEYVLLIGDEDRGIGGFYVYNPDNEALVTDHPYVLLAGEDSFPEAWVGRLSVDTVSELLTVISKILHYEREPYVNDPDWFKKALLVCTVSAAISPQHINNWVGRKLVENGFTRIDTAYYPMQSSLTFISAPINNGVGFVNYRGLGAWDHWIGPFFYNSDIDLLHNGYKLPILTSIVCGGGNFASQVDPVFGEKWLRAGTSGVPKGAVAFIGPSEVHTHTQFNNVIDVALYSAIFDLGIHELGPALWYAKLELWRNYHASQFLPFGQSAEFYLNVYNILGDPGLAVWTDTPRTMLVDTPVALNQSADHLNLTVQDGEGNPVENAFVFLLNSDNALGITTDINGGVTLPFVSGADTTISLTITGPNLNPYLETLAIENSLDEVSYSSFEISPDGILESGTDHSLDLVIQNNASDIETLLLSLTATGPHCSLSDSQLVVGHFAAGANMELANVFSIDIAPLAQHGESVTLTISVDTGSQVLVWSRRFPIQAPDLVITGLEVLSGELAAGDSVELRLSIENQGGQACPPLALIYQNQPLLTASTPQISCDAIGVDETTVTSNPIQLFISEQIFPGEILSISFVTDLAGRSDTLVTSLSMGDIQQFSPSLPDAYGYRVFDDMDVSYSMAPEYEWIEIDPDQGGMGSRLPIYDYFEEDDKAQQMDLPFTVNYYGQSFDAITICSNGWLAMGHSPEVSFYNRVIPSASGPNAMIAPFWDDLITNPGGVSYLVTEDQLIVEWSGMRNLDVSSLLNFEVILYDQDSYPTSSGDNLIKMQFKDYSNFDTGMNFSTTGIEAPDYSTGVQVAFNNSADPSVGQLHGGQALLFTTDRGQRFPGSEMSLSQTSLSFVLNPFTQATDSMLITNSGGSALVYQIAIADESDPEPAPNPLAGFHFEKGGAEPNGELYSEPFRELMDYTWSDQNDPGGPAFNWLDISQPENELVYTFDPDDSYIGPTQLGFAFPYFSETYTQFYFSSNGTMSFVSAAYPWTNLTLPNGSAPAALIAPWWDDLNNDTGVQGVPYFWSNGLDTAIVTWDNFPKFDTNDYHTFQVVLTADGEILFQFLEMAGIVTSSTVGIQNITKNKGLQITYNAGNEIGAGTAIRINRYLSWLSVNAWSGRVDVGETAAFVVNIDTRDMGPSNHTLPLILSTNAVNAPETLISLNLDVINGPPPTGDLNNDYQVNVLDITILIEYVLQVETPDDMQFMRSDLNGDGLLNIMDMVNLVELIQERVG